MLVYLLSLGTWLHALYWGAGISWFAMPGRWRRFWPVITLTSGLTLQSVVVWIGAYLDLRGTERYALATEVLPLLLLCAALLRAGPGRLIRDLVRTSGVLAASLVSMAALVLPYAFSHHGLTTGSLGSCDAADYAGGARSFMEFARSDRVGFMGLVEVTRVMSVDHFFDFYLRLMHFSPCAIVAFNGTIFGCAPHEIIGVLVALFLASAVPVVFWISRDLLRLPSAPSLGVALLFGFSPVNWYAVHQTAMAHILAAQAIGLLTWAAWTLWRHIARAGMGRSLCGVLMIAYCLILGSYSFIVVVCLVPSIAFAFGWTLWSGLYRRFVQWVLWILAPLVGASLLFLPRVSSIVERFAAFKKYDEGWKIPFLWPEGWMGIVKGPLLHAIEEPYHSIAVGLLVAGLLVTFTGLKSRWRSLLFRSICLAVPSLLGCLYLNVRGIHWGHGENRSYLAYKLFCIFYPEILPGLCVWMLLAYRPIAGRIFFWILLGLLLAGVLRVDLRFEQLMVSPPHIVERDLLELRSIESAPDVPSLNLMIPDMWVRLWANSFLLRKPHYFPTHTYEGRLNTPLRGLWDLNGGLIRVTLPAGASRPVNEAYSLADTTSPYFLRVFLDDGWHEPEHILHTSIHWIWSKGDAALRIFNPHPTPLRVSLRLKARSRRARDLQLWNGGSKIGETTIGMGIGAFFLPDILIRPGTNRIGLHSSVPPDQPSADDSRFLGFALYGIELNVPQEQPSLQAMDQGSPPETGPVGQKLSFPEWGSL